MASVQMSDAEKTFILHGVQQDLRLDGRSRRDIRPMVIETGLVTHATGSSHLRLANTDVLVAVKAELGQPMPDEDTGEINPAQGRIEFFVDCSANATPEFEGRGGDDLASDISRVLRKAYRNCFDLEQLCVLEKYHCWVLYVDILILECGGNLFDAVSMAVKAALKNTRIPNVSIKSVDGGLAELELSDDPYDGKALDTERTPLLVTVSRIGNACLVDLMPEEEACSVANLVVGVTPDSKVTAVQKLGAGSFHQETFAEAVRVGAEIGAKLNKALSEKLAQAQKNYYEDREPIGFLR